MEIPVFADNVTIQGDGTEVHPLHAAAVNTALSNIRTNRTVYHITAPDVAAGFANVPVVFAPAFADALYTIAQAITRDGALDLFDVYAPGDNHLIAAAGFTAQIRVNTVTAVAGDVIILNTIAIHD
jgi:hypothetical protein